MNIYFALILNFLPLFICFFAFRFLLRMKFSTELFACLFGLLSVLPGTFLQFYLGCFVPEQIFSAKNGLAGIFCNFFVYNGLVEELIKLVMIALIPHKKLSLRDFFAAALLCGLCLGSFESMIYFLHHLSNARMSGAELLYGLIFARMFSSDLIHVFCAGLCSLFVWGLRHKHNNPMIFVYAVVCHGLFDFFVYFDLWIHWFSVAAILFAVVECRVKYQDMKSRTVAKRKSSGRKKRQAVSSAKQTADNSDRTVVTESPETPAKLKSKTTTKTKVKTERKTSRQKNKIPEDVDVTPELNDDL